MRQFLGAAPRDSVSSGRKDVPSPFTRRFNVPSLVFAMNYCREEGVRSH